MDLDEDLLQVVAKGGSMDYSKWLGLVQPLVDRLNYIVAEEFPPVIYQPEPYIPPQDGPDDLTPQASQSKPSETPSSQESGTTTEPASQSQPPPRALPPVPPFSSPPPPPPPAPQPRNLSSPSPEPPPLPAPLSTLLTSITTTLMTCFSEEPPHTIQRLAELILHPTLHYRTLPAYLRALDRVVSVSSPACIFPLPVASPLPGGILDSEIQVNGPLVNGTNTSTASIEWSETLLGSDESLGGALLTPIPWLRNIAASTEDPTNTTDSPQPMEDTMSENSSTDTPILTPTSSNASPTSDQPAMPSTGVQVPTRENGAVTQGELIRQEQEAGVVPSSQTLHRQTHNALQRAIGNTVSARDFAREEGEEVESDTKTNAETEAPEGGDGGEPSESEVPHARGPDVLGVEDMGLQDGKDVELHLGSSTAKATSAPASALGSNDLEGAENDGDRDAKMENASRDDQDAAAVATTQSSSSGNSKEGKDKEEIVFADAEGTPQEKVIGDERSSAAEKPEETPSKDVP